MDVGQNVSAISNERFVSQIGFNVFDSAAGFEKVRFVNEVQREPSVTILGKRLCESFREPVCIDKKSLDADVDQVIQGEGDEACVEGRDHRLREHICQWAESWG